MRIFDCLNCCALPFGGRNAQRDAYAADSQQNKQSR